MRMEQKLQTAQSPTLCLNPCSNGMRMEQCGNIVRCFHDSSLNPCSNGMRMEQNNNNFNFTELWES